MLTNKHKTQFIDQGYTVIENALSVDELSALNTQIDKWTHESRRYNENYGSLIDGQPRFDLEPGHSMVNPKLRRITNPVEISADFKKTILGDSVARYLVPVLGPNIKFDHCKVNAKYPGMKAEVKYHQDHAFEPQTNDSVAVTMLMLEDNSVENGCLKVVPGSHRTKYSHFQNGSFTGRVCDSLNDEMNANAVNIEAPAGSLILMDTWTVHGSAANRSSIPRKLVITEYKAADAFPLTRHKLPSRYMDAIVLGQDVGTPRYRDELDFDLPPDYQGDSLFDLQDIVEEVKLSSVGTAG